MLDLPQGNKWIKKKEGKDQLRCQCKDPRVNIQKDVESLWFPSWRVFHIFPVGLPEGLTTDVDIAINPLVNHPRERVYSGLYLMKGLKHRPDIRISGQRKPPKLDFRT